MAKSMTNDQREAILKILDGLTALELDGSINEGDYQEIHKLLENAVLDNSGILIEEA